MRILFIVVALAVTSFTSVLLHADFDRAQFEKSVEIGLAELSPRGLLGGIAVPASGEAGPVPVATLYVRSQGGAWGGNNITIYATDDLDLRWTSTNAVSCTGVAFTVTPSGAVSGVQTAVTAPAVGASITYTVNCTGPGASGSASDSLTVTTIAGHHPECSDGVDNTDPEDTLIDWDGGGTDLPATYNFSTPHPDSSYMPTAPFDFNDVTATMEGIGHPSLGGVGFYSSNVASINRICSELGYQTATLGSVHNWYSPDDNTTRYWNGSSWVTVWSNSGTPTCSWYNNTPDGNYCMGWVYPYNSGVNTLTCSNPAATLTPDPGCTSPEDDDERDGPPAVTLSVRNGGSSWTGDDITIATGNQINLRWESSNATQCVATAFTIGAIGSATNLNGTQTTVTEPAAGASTLYRITCTGSGGPAATDSLTVTAVAAQLPTIDAVPLIVRSGEKSTITWNVGTADPAECSMTGKDINSLLLTKQTGTSEVTITGETTFSIACPLGSDSVTVKVLPVIQET